MTAMHAVQYRSRSFSVFSSAVEKRENQNIQDYDFACGSVWVWNLVSDIKGGTPEDVWEQRAWRYLDRIGMRWQESGENCITMSFMTCTLRHV
jgi:hypothetical protein